MSDPDPRNWQACYDELAPRLVIFARSLVRSTADAEDIVQNAFVRFWKARPDAQPEHYPLLFAAVRSAALDWRRKEDRRLQRETDHAAQNGELHVYFEHGLDRSTDALAVSAALDQLPETQREVLVLRIWGELTFAEIAGALDESINTITARYRYALTALRQILKPHVYERV